MIVSRAYEPADSDSARRPAVRLVRSGVGAIGYFAAVSFRAER